YGDYNCSRKFSIDLVPKHVCKNIEKHAKICQKTATKKRKVFDSSRQRAEGTDIPVLKPIKPKLQENKSFKPPKKQSNWRKKHEDFIATIRAAKSLTQVMKEGGPLPPPPPPSYDPDYIQCPYCQRRFNESAADRHIKFCQEQAARIPTKGKLGDPKKTPGRTQVKKVPLLTLHWPVSPCQNNFLKKFVFCSFWLFGLHFSGVYHMMFGVATLTNYFFFLCIAVPSVPRTGTGPRLGGWTTDLEYTFLNCCNEMGRLFVPFVHIPQVISLSQY
uniref:Zinc finger C2HC domain-containing protein 1A n=1 Tax=Oryzias sinensis TaxID=183150 RepID=A0A8C7ZPY4_9TELE